MINPMRIFRAAILNGVTPPATAVASLEAQGVDIAELENRLRQSIDWRR
jgi:hypothetical protein